MVVIVNGKEVETEARLLSDLIAEQTRRRRQDRYRTQRPFRSRRTQRADTARGR